MKHKMKMLAISVVMACGAGISNAQAQSCDFDVSFNVDVNEQQIVFSKEQQKTVVITDDNALTLDGQQQSLNGEQKRLLNAYAKQIRSLLPAASELAEDASLLALGAIKDVTAVLLEHNPDKAQQIIARVDEIANGLKQHISDNHLRPDGIREYLEGSEFEKEFEALIEESVTEFVQSNIPNMIAAAMSGDDDKVKAFEERMEKFGEEMEAKYEQQAELIEQKAEALCQLVKEIEQSEDQFVKAFDKYDEYQLIAD